MMEKSILIIGNSHTNCIRRVVKNNKLPNVEIINSNRSVHDLNQMDMVEYAKKFKEKAVNKFPFAVCLCVAGDYHNILGIVENPCPFSVGEKTKGSAPVNTANRWFIPYHVMRDQFKQRFEQKMVQPLMNAIYSEFDGATNLFMSPPPPFGDWEFVKKNPRKYKDNLHLGDSPDALKLQLYDLQSQILCQYSQAAKAEFVATPSQLLNSEGFLKKEYFRNDPSHANDEYGLLMLKELYKRAENPK